MGLGKTLGFTSFGFVILSTLGCGRPGKLPAQPAASAAAATSPAKVPRVPFRLQGRFLRAIDRGDLAMVRALLDEGASVNQRSTTGYAPLDTAAIVGSVEICQFLLEKGASLNGEPGDYPPVYHALTRGQLDTARFLLDRGASLKWDLTLKMSPVRAVIQTGSLPLLDLVLERGAAVDSAALLDAVTMNATPVVARLLDRGADAGVRDEEGRTPLMLAAREGKAAELELLLNRRADVNAKDAVGKTALMHASGPDRERIIARLKHAGAREFEPTLAEAVKQEDPALVRALLARGANVNERDEQGRTPLFYALKLLGESVLGLLLENGGDPDARDAKGISLVEAAKAQHNRKAINQLIAAGASAPEIAVFEAIRSRDAAKFSAAFTKAVDPNARDESGTPLLIYAIENGYSLEYPVAVDTLLGRGADVNARDLVRGHTALGAAAAGGHVDLARRLIDKGADLNAPDVDGNTPVMLTENVQADAIFRLLIERGARASARNKDGITILMMAAGSYDPEFLKFIYDHGGSADLQSATLRGLTALHVAAQRGSSRTLKQLLDWGADLQAASSYDRDPPLIDAVNGQEEFGDYPATVRLLLQAGADPNGSDRYGRTALELAKARGDTAIIQMLKAAGARPTPSPTSRPPAR